MVLVTGGTGLVGAHLLLKLLRENQKVRAIYRTSNALQKTKDLFETHQAHDLFEKIEWIAADILDIPALEMAFQNIEMVYHAAALISFDPKDEEKLRKTNIEGTANIVNCALAFGVKKLCYFSSIAAMGDATRKNQFIDETTEWNPEKPHSDYAISKHGAEMEVWRGYQEGLKTIILNPGVILGAGYWDSGSGQLFQHAEKGLPYFSNGVTGYIAVEDVVEIAYSLTQKDINGEQYCLVAENCSFQKILELLAISLQKKIPNKRLQPWFVEILWRLDGLRSTLFGSKRLLSKPMARSLFSQDYFSSQKVITTLNYQFLSIETTIQQLGISYRNRKK